MSIYRRYFISALSLVIALAALAGLYGCDGSSGVSDLPERNSYSVTGVFVKDLNTSLMAMDSSWVATQFARNDSLLTGAGVVMDTDTLVFMPSFFLLDSVYSFGAGQTGLLPTGIYELDLADASRFGDTLLVTVPDTFRVDFYEGDSTVPNAGGVEMTISWTAAQNVEGYVVAVVKENLIYSGVGYSKYVTAQGTQTTIPPEAFRQLPNNELDVGTYYLFVYGFSGSPDSAFTSELLPVPLPSQLTDNIDQQDLVGRFGCVVVTNRVPKVVEVIL